MKTTNNTKPVLKTKKMPASAQSPEKEAAGKKEGGYQQNRSTKFPVERKVPTKRHPTGGDSVKERKEPSEGKKEEVRRGGGTGLPSRPSFPMEKKKKERKKICPKKDRELSPRRRQERKLHVTSTFEEKSRGEESRGSR